MGQLRPVSRQQVHGPRRLRDNSFHGCEPESAICWLLPLVLADKGCLFGERRILRQKDTETVMLRRVSDVLFLRACWGRESEKEHQVSLLPERRDTDVVAQSPSLPLPWTIRVPRAPAKILDHKFGTDGRWLSLCSMHEETVYDLSGGVPRLVWQPWTGVSLKRRATQRGHRGPVDIVAWTPRSDILATGSSDATARLWQIDGVTNSCIAIVAVDGGIESICFAPTKTITLAVETQTGETFMCRTGA
jgi:hypothetical protein